MPSPITDEESLPEQQRHLDEDISIHLFTVSATMVGVCLTVIGIIRIVISIHKMDTLADDLLAVDSLLFLGSCVLSYWALRTRRSRRMRQVEHAAELVFVLAMLLMVIACGLIAYAVF